MTIKDLESGQTKPPQKNTCRRLSRLCILMMASALVLTACNFKHKSIGKYANYDATFCCACDSLPATCEMGTDSSWLVFEVGIKEGDAPGTYVAEGIIDTTKGKIKSWDSFLTAHTLFYLLLAKDNIIFRAIPFQPRRQHLSSEIPFKLEFESEAFDGVCITGKIGVVG